MKQSFCIFHFWKFLLFPLVITFGHVETLKVQDSNCNKRLDIAGAVLWPANFKVHSRMNISCDAQDQLSPMPEMLIKTSTWYVKFRLAVHNAPDFYIAQHIKQVLDSSDQERHIRTLSNVSFSYSAEHQWYGNALY